MDAQGALRFERIELGGCRAEHATGGSGPSVLFLHGWGVGPRSYSDALVGLLELGCRVLAPALPCFGGTPPLSGSKCSFPGYAQWLVRYLEEQQSSEPVVVVGHSFGGGVALQFAHDHPERVRSVVMCNGVGGLDGAGGERPLWSWGRELGSDLLAPDSVTRVLPAVLGVALPNLVQNPVAVWRASGIARHADLRREARVLRRRGMPMTVVWSDRDRLVSHGSVSAMCRAAGVEPVVVAGHHSWLIADPKRFADVVLLALVEAGVIEESLLRLTA
jgi:pimeloyl-ACP methyl ester carboxylesterase